MKKILLAATMFGALAGYSNTANALVFTQSNAFGTGNFGSITANCIDLACTIVGVHVDVGANTLVRYGLPQYADPLAGG